MLRVFVPGANGLVLIEPAAGAPLPEQALWFDLLDPTPEEEQRVERALSIDVPTRDEMREIESSNRLYEEKGALHRSSSKSVRRVSWYRRRARAW